MSQKPYFVIVLLLLIIPVSAFGAQVELTWNPPTSWTPAGYRLFYGTSSGTYLSVIDAGNSTTHTVTSLQDNITYYFIVKAYTSNGDESPPSNEFSWGNFPQPPTTTPLPSEGTLTTLVFGNASNSNKPNTVQDTYLNNNAINYAADALTLNTYTWPTNTPANRILMKWDLSSIPKDAVVHEATLYLYMYNTEGDGGKSDYTIAAHKITGVNPVITACSWDSYDGSRSWTGGANGGAQNISAAESSTVVDKTAGYKSWKIAKMVQEWVQTPGTNFGLILNSDANAAADSNRLFRPSEFAESNKRPYLVVKYAASGSGGSAPQLPGTPPNPRIVN